ncbi:Alcohol dehydrogenase [hydrothermal vent metagenome]|uniref:Alcohol dehydrogenase n=1 Tax=hydrothermal vent metagenome TaxID=652676 RepID=A0A3B1CZH6_9ZZZZ
MKILPLPEIVIGKNVLKEVPAVLKKISGRRVMVVTDPGLKKAGILKPLEAVLNEAVQEIIVFDEVAPDPSIELVSRVVDLAKKEKVDAVIGLGGGSPIDTAKVAAALVTNTKNIEAYFGIDLLEKNALPIIAIPTTAGTGSEVTPIAILSDEEEKLKKGIVSSKIIPQYAFLDPVLTVGLPPAVTAATGMDALTHAIEAYTSVNASPYSDALSLKAMYLIKGNLKRAFDDGKDVAVRENMLLGSLLAGMAFAHAGVAAVHAFAYPLGGMFHIPHGLANTLMLATIMEFNIIGSEQKYKDIAIALGVADENIKPEMAIEVVRELKDSLDMPKSLADINIPKDSIGKLAEGAMKVTRLLANNPRQINLEDAKKLYETAYATAW